MAVGAGVFSPRFPSFVPNPLFVSGPYCSCGFPAPSCACFMIALPAAACSPCPSLSFSPCSCFLFIRYQVPWSVLSCFLPALPAGGRFASCSGDGCFLNGWGVGGFALGLSAVPWGFPNSIRVIYRGSFRFDRPWFVRSCLPLTVVRHRRHILSPRRLAVCRVCVDNVLHGPFKFLLVCKNFF